MKYREYIRLVVLAMALSFTAQAFAEEKNTAGKSGELFKEIATQDSLLFAAFNTQNMPAFKSFFSTDLPLIQHPQGLILIYNVSYIVREYYI